mgnify:CR=1 FL=1
MTLNMKRFVFLVVTLLMMACCSAPKREFAPKEFTASSGQVLPYRVIYPDNFDPLRQYPLLLFLHGAGERGSDNELQLVHGRDLFEGDPLLRDMIVVAPQCSEAGYWVRIVRPVTPDEIAGRTFPYDAGISDDLLAVKELLDCFIALGYVDTDAVYGTGLSMGGMGVLDLMLRYPDFFAAIQPICGAANAQRCAEYKGRTRVRFFQGLDDPVVAPHFSQEDCEALGQAGVPVEYVGYPGVQHNSWDNAFAEKDFISWFIAQD